MNGLLQAPLETSAEKQMDWCILYLPAQSWPAVCRVSTGCVLYGAIQGPDVMERRAGGSCVLPLIERRKSLEAVTSVPFDLIR